MLKKKSPCVFTKGLEYIELPVRHGEGKFIADSTIMDELEKNGQIALRYAMADGSPALGRFPENPNGALGDVAGICDQTGRILGLMPHPEAFCHFTNHPEWTFRKEAAKRKGDASVFFTDTDGLKIFKNAVRYFE